MALTDNLVAYYKFDSGALTTDSSGNGKTLTNTGSVAEGAAKLGTASASFNASTSQRMSIADNLGFSTTSNMTWNFWLKMNALPGGYILDLHTTTGAARELTIYNDASRLRVYTWANDLAASGTISTGTWYMVTLTCNSSGTVTLYTDTVSQGTVALSGANGSVDITSIGCQDTATTAINGLIDAMGVWTRILSGAEITSLYNGGAGLDYPFSAGSTVNSNFLSFM